MASFEEVNKKNHGIIKLLSIIILIFINKQNFNHDKLQPKKKKVDKKLFLFKTINLSCEEVDIKITKRKISNF